ncbi:MAG TPA: HAMP domain-containing sensor histidine kinase, partial [Thermoanaerobaculia bacterium]
SEREQRLAKLASALVHRFNNVLMGIQPHVEVIKRIGRDNDRILGSVTQIESALRRAKAVLNEVSRLAKPLVLDLRPLEVDPWFDSLRTSLQPFASAPVELTFAAQPPHLMLSADREQLTQAIVNLVTNAVESMPNGGTVAVSAREAADGIELEIADSGSGIAPEAIERVFEPMYTTKRNSAGLGLPIVRQIVEAHGGTLHLESTPGVGTKVVVILPLPRAGEGGA